MRESKQEPTQQTTAHAKQQDAESSVGLLTAPAVHAPMVSQIQRLGRSPAGGFGGAIAPHSAPNQNLVLHLQRQYGNAYVQRLVALSRQGDGEADAAPEVEAGIEQARGSGQPLERAVQRQMESAFGTDFGGVRVHTDSSADSLNQALSARAFTTGQDIFFRQGEYSPSSSGGKELLAHELTHVVQQTGGVQARRIQSKLAIGQPDDPYEREADQVAKSVMQMDGLATAEGAAGLTQRQIEEEEESLQCPTGGIAQRQMGSEEELSQATADSFLINRKVGPQPEEGLDETKGGCGCAPCGKTVPILAGVMPESRVLRHLKSSENKPEKSSLTYRNAILQFQRANSSDKMTTFQQQLLDSSKSVDVSQKDNSKTLRRSLAGCTPPKKSKGQVKSGPTYTPSGTLTPTANVDGSKSATFKMSAEFDHDPANDIYASCCEVRQYIKWSSDADRPRNPGFSPAGSFSANTWYEDRDSVGKRYGHRAGPYSECISINHYEDSSGTNNCATGSIYKGEDAPKDGSGTKTGVWDFELKVIDTCNGDKQIGSTATVSVDW